MNNGGRGIREDSELGRAMDVDDIRQLNRPEARERLKMGIDSGEKRKTLKEISGDIFEDVTGKKPGF